MGKVSELEEKMNEANRKIGEMNAMRKFTPEQIVQITDGFALLIEKLKPQTIEVIVNGDKRGHNHENADIYFKYTAPPQIIDKEKQKIVETTVD